MLKSGVKALKSTSRKFNALMLAAFLVLGSGIALIEAEPAQANPCPTGWTFVGVNCERTYFHTGDKQTFTVPPGVRQISFVAAGARGGALTDAVSLNRSSGAVVSGVLPTNGGDVLNLYVGGNGGAQKGGFNGGGDGASSGFSSSQPSASQQRDTNQNTHGPGYGGGGATDIRVNGTALSNRQVVAGGGGGSAIYRLCYPNGWIYLNNGVREPQPAYCSTASNFYGGNAIGVGVTAPPNLIGTFYSAGSNGGNAAANAGGVRGSLTPVSNWVGCDAVNSSTAGALGVGGVGGSLQRSTEPNYQANGWAWEWCPGGGGGGGYYGGGGATFGGGGAGSSYLAPAVVGNTAPFSASFSRPPADSFYAFASIKSYGANPYPTTNNTPSTISTVESLSTLLDTPSKNGGGFIRLAYRGTTVLSVVPQGVNADGELTSKTITYRVTFAEKVTGFATSNLSLEGASGTNGTWVRSITAIDPDAAQANAASIYDVVVDNQSAIDGVVTLVVNATGTTSVTNTPGLGTLKGSATIDTTGPATGSVVMSPPSTKTSPVNYTFTFDEPVSFVGAAADMSKLSISTRVTDNVTRTAASWVIGAPTISQSDPKVVTIQLTYSGTLTSADSGALLLEMAPDFLQDALGNRTTTTSSGTSYIDYTAPTITQADIAPPANTAVSGTTRYTNLSTIPFTLTFSEDVRHLYASNYSDSNRKSFSVTGSATGCVATPAAAFSTDRRIIVNVTGCSDGTITLNVLTGKIEDLAGNAQTFGSGNALATTVSSVQITKDTVLPGWAGSNQFTSSSAPNSTSIDYVINFNGPVYGITANDLVLSGGSSNGTWTKTLVSGADGSASYTIRVSNSEPQTGILYASLAAGAGTDIAGNPTPASSAISGNNSFVNSRELYFPPELTVGTLNGLSGTTATALMPNATIKDRGTGSISGFRVVLKNFKTGDNLALDGFTGRNTIVGLLSTKGSDKVFDVWSNTNGGYMTIAEAQAALRAVKWNTTGTDRSAARTIEVILRPSPDFLYETRHFYKNLNRNGLNRSDASNAAQGSYLGASKGYLPTIRSAEENAIVDSVARDQVIWLGGRNSNSNWSWYTWNNGPDNGVQFANEHGSNVCLFGCTWFDDVFRTSSSVGGNYNNWQTDLFGGQAEPNNTSDDMTMDKNGRWDDGKGLFDTTGLVVEYGDQTIGDSVWDTKLYKSQSFTFDSSAPTVTLTSSPDLVNDKAVFTLTGNESLDCSSLTVADFDSTGLDALNFVIKQVASTVCEIAAPHTIAAGQTGSVTLQPSNLFSVKDQAGNSATTIATGAQQSLSFTIPVPPTTQQLNTAVSTTTYNLVPPSTATTGFTPLDDAARVALETALTQARIVEPPAGAPARNSGRDISSLPSNARYELSDEISVIQGTKVGAQFRVNQGRRNTHEAWGYIRVGTGDWLALGKQTLTASGSADLAAIGQMAFTQVGTYQLKIVVVSAGTIMPARVLRGANFNPVLLPNQLVTPAKAGFLKRAAVSDSQLSGVGDDSYQLTVNVTPAAAEPTVVPVAPYVISTSATPNTGTFKAGDDITITVKFSDAVEVSGSPQVKFNFNGVEQFATYASGSGTDELTFRLTVQSGTNSADLDYASATALELNGGSIVEVVSSGTGANAMLGLPAPGASGSISAAASVVVDTTAPKVDLTSEASIASSSTINYRLTSDSPIDCSSLSTVSGEDFTFTEISAITSIVQTSSTLCTITATSSVAPGATGTSSLALASTFSATDPVGNATSSADLGITSASIEVTVAATPVTPPTAPITPSPTPTPTVSPTPTPTATPTPTPTVSPSPTRTPTPSPTGTRSPSPSPTASPSASQSQSSNSSDSDDDDPLAGGSTTGGSAGGSGGGTNSGGSGSGSTGTTDPSKTSSPSNLALGPGSIDPTDPVGSLANLLSPGNIVIPQITPGEPIANPAIGATGDDSAPAQPFEPLASEESTAAVTALVTSVGSAVAAVAAVAGAAVAAAAAGAAGAVGAAGAAASGAAASGAAGSAAGATSGSTASASAMSASSATASATAASTAGSAAGSGATTSSTVPAGGAGGATASAVAAASRFARANRRFAAAASRLAKVSPLAAKMLLNGLYLRAILGRFYPAVLLASAGLAAFAAIQNGSEFAPPAWQLLIALAVIGLFDSLAGITGLAVLTITSMVLAGVDASNAALLVGIALIWIAPGMVARSFRSISRDATNRVWEFVVQAAITTLMVGWLTSAAVATLPALAGSTLVAANHVTDIAIALAAAALARLLVEELIAKRNPELASALEETDLPSASWLQRVISLLLKLSIFILLSGAIFGYNEYVVIGSILFVLPTALQWFADRLPNSVILWKLLPTGLPGLNLVLLVAGFTTSIASASFTGDLAPAMVFMVLPIPLLVLAILGLFGRHGETPGAQRPILAKKFAWLYRIGGAIMFVVALQLTGII